MNHKETTELAHSTERFFARLQQDTRGRILLGEQSQRIEFELRDGGPFFVEIHEGQPRVRLGRYKPRRFDDPDLIHFELDQQTLLQLLQGEIRFTDALIPVDRGERSAMLLHECTLFKWSVLNWIGRLFRAAQTRCNSSYKGQDKESV